MRWSSILLFAAAGLAAPLAHADPEEFSYCGWNPQIHPYNEPCYRTYEEAEQYVRQDSSANNRRRFLDVVMPGSFVDNSGGQREHVYYRTRKVPPDTEIATWYSASTHIGTAVADSVPAPDVLITQLLPDEQVRGRYSEGAVIDDILAFDNASSGTLSGELAVSPPGGPGPKYDPVLDRAQVSYDFSSTPTRLFTTGREWGITKRSRWWCPPGMNLASDGMCSNSEEGRIRIFTNLNHQSCPVLGKPCVPATGAKELHEQDFTWGAWTFTRHYSSLPTLVTSQPQGKKWSHTFQAYLLPMTGYEGNVHGVDEFQHIELYSRVDSTLFRATNVIGTRIEYVSIDPLLRWKRSKGDGRIEYYGANGRLTRIELTHNFAASVDLTYCDAASFATGLCSAIDELWKVQDAGGRVLEFVYAPPSFTGSGATATYVPPLLTGIRTAGQWLVNYSHDGSGRLVSATRPDATVRQYHYGETANLCVDSDGTPLSPCSPAIFGTYLTGITDESGTRLSTYTYDLRGRVTSSVWNGGAYIEKLDYPSQFVREVTYPEGDTTTITYGFINRFLRPLTLQNSDGTVTHTYHYTGRRETTTDQLGVKKRFTYTDDRLTSTVDAELLPEQRTVQQDWNATAGLVSERRTIAAGATTPSSKSVYTFNSRGQVLTRSDVDPVSLVNRTQTFSYCESADVAVVNSTCPKLGLLKSVDGPRTDVSDTTTFDYYPSTDETGCGSTGPCHRKGDLWKTTNAAGHVFEVLKYDTNGRAVASKNPNGVITELTYHPRGWLATRTVKGAGPGEDAVTTFAYDDNGQVTRVTHPDGDFLDYEYDNAQRLVAVEDALGNRIEYTLDAAGNRILENTKDALGVIQRQQSRVFDSLGRLEQVLNESTAIVAETSYDAAGNPISSQDALGTENRQEFDPLRRLKETIQDYAGLDVTTQLSYDPLDRLTKVTDPKGLFTEYGYDGLGNLTELDSPDTGQTIYTHDSAGNIATKTDARGVTSVYSYDSLNRLTGISYPDSALNVTFQYDQAGSTTGCTSSFPLGRLTRMLDASGTTTYCYDRRGNLAFKRPSASSPTTSGIEYEYTRGDRLRRLTYPSGVVIEYSYDAAGASETVSKVAPGSAASIVTQTDRMPFGPITSIAFAGGQTLLHSYNADYQITAVSGLGLDLTYTPDSAGNITAISDANSSETRSYTYDPLSRLTTVSDGAATVVEAFTYDGTGNRLSKQVGPLTETYGYPSTSHRLTSVGPAMRTYDAAGNMTTNGEGWTFTYADNGRLTQATNGTVTQINRYNGKGERVLKIEEWTDVAGLHHAEVVFQYDEAGQLIREKHSSWVDDGVLVDTAPDKWHDYVWLDARPVAIVANASALDQGELLHIGSDHLGTPRSVYSLGTTSVVWSWPATSEPFGDSLPSGSVKVVTGVEFNLRFPGQYVDRQTRLYQNYFRDYDATAGRFVESDPTGLRAGINTFLYGMANPITFTDRYGLHTEFCYTAFEPVTEFNALTRQIDVLYLRPVRRCQRRQDLADYECVRTCDDGMSACEAIRDGRLLEMIIDSPLTGIQSRAIALVAGAAINSGMDVLNLGSNGVYLACQGAYVRCMKKCDRCE